MTTRQPARDSPARNGWDAASGNSPPDGGAFYTVPVDYFNCPVGSYARTGFLHPVEREQELPQVLEVMTELGYLKVEEVPGIPHLAKTPGVVIYTPLGETPVEPDAVIPLASLRSTSR